jgi:hypothetical protein
MFNSAKTVGHVLMIAQANVYTSERKQIEKPVERQNKCWELTKTRDNRRQGNVVSSRV